MKKTINYSFLIIVLLISTSFALKRNAEGQVMVYGIVTTTQCSSDGYYTYKYKIVDADDEYSAKTALKNDLENQYPSGKVRVSSSKYDFGASASNVCILKWQKKNNGCGYNVLIFSFGKTEDDAYNRAETKKKTWADAGASSSVVEQRSF